MLEFVAPKIEVRDEIVLRNPEKRLGVFMNWTPG
jgi:hypothetical protein